MKTSGLGIVLAAAVAVFPSVTGASGQTPKATGIPLCPGLQVVTAINQKEGDYESIKTIESVTADTVRLKYSNERRETDPLAEDYDKMKKTTLFRSVRKKDLVSATFYAQKYFPGAPETIPESTAIGVSSNVLRDLKAKAGGVPFSISNAYDGNTPAERDVRPNVYDFTSPGELKRVSTGPVKVLVNNVLTELPTVKASGDFYGEKAEFVILDDPGNPLVLSFRTGIATIISPNQPPADADTLKVVKITHRCPLPAAPAAPPPSSLAADLAKSGKVAIYDIYFDFNEAKLREESEPRLKEIADVMKANPAWRLSVAGHTDSVASDAFNLDLSRRRAAAVKAALVSRYGIAATRLDTTGHGESQPRDSNDTVEGRARNRRVELQKL